MKKISTATVLKATKGVLVGGPAGKLIEKVVIDSREVGARTLFIPVIGEVSDGHNYARSAAENGCEIMMVHKKDLADELKRDFPDLTLLLVEDTTRGLQDLAEYYLNQFDVIKIAVTGSVGKTTAKEMMAAVFAQKYNTVRNLGNFNNHLGLPLTIFHIEEDTEAVVLEMGMSEFGEIHRLVDIVRPQLAVVTNIGASHIEYLKTRENILKAKLEITDYFTPAEILIVNSDADLLAAAPLAQAISEKQAAEAGYGGEFQLYTAGCQGHPDFQVSQVRDLGEHGIKFHVTSRTEEGDFHVPLLGVHNTANAVLAIAAGSFFGISMAEAARGLAEVENAARRLNVENIDGVLLIDDSYNASVESMKAAVDVLMSVSGQRKIAILADILELGAVAEDHHRQVGRYVGEKAPDLLLVYGPYGRILAEEAKLADGPTQVRYYEEKEPLITDLLGLLKEGDAVLVKGSNGMKMTEVISRIRSR